MYVGKGLQLPAFAVGSVKSRHGVTVAELHVL